MNGNARLGVLFALFGGSMGTQGADMLSENAWAAWGLMILGLLVVFAAFNEVNKGIEESIRLHDLKKAAKTDS